MCMARFLLLTTFALLIATPSGAGAAVDSQRKAFREALPQAEAGNWAGVEPHLAALSDYPLLPDLRAAWLRSRNGTGRDDEFAEFLKQYPDLGFSAGLRRHWAGSLARRGEWARYLALYEAHYAGSNDTVLHCHALTARIRLGRTDGLEPEAIRRWLAPVSQPDECDPAFEWLAQRGALTAEHRRQRMELALHAGQFGLANWLARPLGEAAVAEVGRWERMHADPKARIGLPANWQDTAGERALLLHGFHRLASTDPGAAAEQWPRFRERFAFGAEERAGIDRRIAMVHAWRLMPGARAMLDKLPEDSHDSDTRAWRVRLAIRAQDWQAIDEALGGLAPDTASEPVWRYWRARSLEADGRKAEAKPIFGELATERGYYSFMSADRIGADYNWRHAQTVPNEDVIAILDGRPDVRRPRELFFTGLETSGRVEWQQVMAKLSAAERAQASIMATRWGWYSRAITAASGGGVEDDLDLRFPLPWRPVFEDRSKRAGINKAWAYGVARSESLFMPDVSSGAGAIGLMQLMPATGRETARRAGIPYQGQRTLLDPDTNVALGTTYLAEMLQRFGNHRVLATAAYNAGPGRVDRWLPDEGALPAEVWVESVPFNETRGYIQRVLASEAVFEWRLSGDTVRISDAMQPVPSKLRR
jgi:soluble lytic murein transglycosylase